MHSIHLFKSKGHKLTLIMYENIACVSFCLSHLNFCAARLLEISHSWTPIRKMVSIITRISHCFLDFREHAFILIASGTFDWGLMYSFCWLGWKMRGANWCTRPASEQTEFVWTAQSFFQSLINQARKENSRKCTLLFELSYTANCNWQDLYEIWCNKRILYIK